MTVFLPKLDEEHRRLVASKISIHIEAMCSSQFSADLFTSTKEVLNLNGKLDFVSSVSMEMVKNCEVNDNISCKLQSKNTIENTSVHKSSGNHVEAMQLLHTLKPEKTPSTLLKIL